MDSMSNKQLTGLLPIALSQTSLQMLMLGSLLALAVIAFLAIYISRSRFSAKGKLVLLVGDEDAGKTAILSAMAYERTFPTHTSFQVNSSLVKLPHNQLQVVDVPGHPRLRGLFKQFVADAKAIVFVVDASTITRNGRDVAENLHHVLHAITSLPPTRALPPLLILAHKTDLLSASASFQDRSSLAVSRVRTVLERELEKRRAAAAGGVGVEGLGEEGGGTEIGGLECRAGSAFRFAQWEGGEVDFAGTWVKVGSDTNEKASEEKSVGPLAGLNALSTWLDELI